MINCGGTLDLVELLRPDESVVFFILDSHRPYDLCNIYSERQICILGKPEEDNEIPEYNDIFRDDSVRNSFFFFFLFCPILFLYLTILFDYIQSDEEDVSEESDNENEGRQSKRRRLNEEDLLRRGERRKWVENRTTILFNYLQYSYYGKSVCNILII